MADRISEVAHRLAENAEAVCRHYLRTAAGKAATLWLGMSTLTLPRTMLQPIDRITLT